MYGWRARIGCINPLRGDIPITAMEMEMAAPEGVIFNHTFLDGPHSLDPDHLRTMLPQLEPAARELISKTSMDLILMAGAPIVLANGADKVIELLEKATGLPATTNLTGIVRGLRRLDIQKVVVVCPYYSERMAEMVREFLVAAGFDIVSLVRGDVPFGTLDEIPPHRTYRLAKGAFLEAPPADGLFLAGGGGPTSTILEALETDIAAPVVANNFASLWNCLDILHVRQPIKGYGKLLTCF